MGGCSAFNSVICFERVGAQMHDYWDLLHVLITTQILAWATMDTTNWANLFCNVQKDL